MKIHRSKSDSFWQTNRIRRIPLLAARASHASQSWNLRNQSGKPHPKNRFSTFSLPENFLLKDSGAGPGSRFRSSGQKRLFPSSFSVNGNLRAGRSVSSSAGGFVPAVPSQSGNPKKLHSYSALSGNQNSAAGANGDQFSPFSAFSEMASPQNEANDRQLSGSPEMESQLQESANSSSETRAETRAETGSGDEFPVKTERMKALEALLFLTREPLGPRRLAQFLGSEESSEILTEIRQLNAIYDSSHSAFRILEFARGFQLRTRPQFTPWLRQLCHQGGIENQESPEIRLSPPAMETLAIIAYREAFDSPVTRAEIEAIRGVQSCMEILRQLLGKDLIRIAGRSTELGRPRLYRTTRKFLEVFGLKSLLQLPKVDLT